MKKITTLSKNALTKVVTNPKRALKMSKTALNILLKEGPSALRTRMGEVLLDPYPDWFAKTYGLADSDRELIRKRIDRLGRKPLISVLMPVYDTPEIYLREAIESVLSQLYPHWELCIADDNSPNEQTRDILREYEKRDPRIRVVYRKQNGRIAQASNSALDQVTGEFVALLDHDDLLTETALYMMAEEINAHPDADLIYSDEDKLLVDGTIREPYFKPNWNIELFYCQNFINHLSAYRTSIFKKIGGFREGFNGSQDYDMVLRFLEASGALKEPQRVRHIPHVLYHWRAIPGSVALAPGEKSYAHDNARKAIREHLGRIGRKAQVTEGFGSFHRVIYDLPQPAPQVTAIVCTRDRKDLLEVTMDGLFALTDYPNLEILVVDNQSSDPETLRYLDTLPKEHRNVKIVRYDAPFNFAAMNNFAAKEASGEILAFLNNDLKMIAADWLKEMVTYLIQPGVGAVGAKLYYANDTIQHAGVVMGISGTAGHAFKNMPRKSFGTVGGRVYVHQCYSAVTAACVAVRRDLFEKLGGFDAKNFAVAFNDVDLCLRIWEAGYKVVYNPYAELYHLESVTRGSDASDRTILRFVGETSNMWQRWKHVIHADPFYNPNMTLIRDDFTLSSHPRISRPWLNESPSPAFQAREPGSPSIGADRFAAK